MKIDIKGIKPNLQKKKSRKEELILFGSKLDKLCKEFNISFYYDKLYDEFVINDSYGSGGAVQLLIKSLIKELTEESRGRTLKL